jgi:ribulose-bisphosphate carboxylase large chain
MTDRITATYWIETAYPLADAASSLAGEQSSGTFVKVPGQTAELEARAAARVLQIDELDAADSPSLPGAGRPPGASGDAIWRRARIVVDWPFDNVGASLPNLMSTLAGNLFELRAFSGLRLLDFTVPKPFHQRYPGPAFGVAGTRRLSGVFDRPLIGTIIKPSVGLTPAGTAAMVDALCAGGIDFIKDDELQADGPACPFEARVDSVMEVIDRHAQRSGRKAMFAFNLTGDVDQMRKRHDHVVARGGTCVMASLNAVGLAGFSALRAHCALPIHAHRNGWGYLSRHPALGFDYVAWQKFWRLAGADHMHVNGLANKFCEDDASVIRSARACLTPIDPAHPCTVMPVFSSGQWAGQAAGTYAALGSTDLIHAAGGGICGHPDGIEAGVASMREAWAAAVAGVPLAQHARQHPALARAIDAFGAKSR